MKRRHFLKTLPLTACLAGCTNESGRETTTTREIASGEIAVQYRSSYRYTANVDGIRVKPPENDQFAFISPPVSEADPLPSPGAFSLTLGDERFSPATSVPDFTPDIPGVGGVYTTDNRNGSLMFDIPTTDVERAALLYDDTRYPLTEDARNRLAIAPAFSLESVSVPDSVTPNDDIELRITVSNDGDAAGIYLAGFRYSGVPRDIDIPVEPGETGTGSVTYDTYVDSGVMTFEFSYPGGRRDYEVAVDPESGVDRP